MIDVLRMLCSALHLFDLFVLSVPVYLILLKRKAYNNFHDRLKKYGCEFMTLTEVSVNSHAYPPQTGICPQTGFEHNAMVLWVHFHRCFESDVFRVDDCRNSGLGTYSGLGI